MTNDDVSCQLFGTHTSDVEERDLALAFTCCGFILFLKQANGTFL